MAPQTLSEIPTLTELYARKTLAPHPDRAEEELYPASADLNARVSLLRGDITKLQIGAVVNAAKQSLQGGGGVDGAIHTAAGPGLRRECSASYPDGCRTGEAVITSGQRLPARHIIHTVGPIVSSLGSLAAKEPLLASCYRESLALAAENDAGSVAFPCISTGVYGYPKPEACAVALEAVREFLEADDKIERVIFVVFESADVALYTSMIPLYFPPPA